VKLLNLATKCENEIEGKKCGHMMDVEIPLLDIKVDTVNLPETIQLIEYNWCQVEVSRICSIGKT